MERRARSGHLNAMKTGINTQRDKNIDPLSGMNTLPLIENNTPVIEVQQ